MASSQVLTCSRAGFTVHHGLVLALGRRLFRGKKGTSRTVRPLSLCVSFSLSPGGAKVVQDMQADGPDWDSVFPLRVRFVGQGACCACCAYVLCFDPCSVLMHPASFASREQVES